MPAYLSEGSKRYNQARRIAPHDIIAKLDYYLSGQSDTNSSAASAAASVGSIENSRRSNGGKDTSSSDRLRTRSQRGAPPGEAHHDEFQIGRFIRREHEGLTSASTSSSSSTASSKLASSASSYGINLNNYFELQKKVKKHAQAIGQRLLSSSDAWMNNNNKKSEHNRANNPANIVSSSDGSPINSSGLGEEMTSTLAGASVIDMYPKKQHQIKLGDVSQRHLGLDRGASWKFKRGPPRRNVACADKDSDHSRDESVLGEQYGNHNKPIRTMAAVKPTARPMIHVNGRRNKIGRLRRLNQHNRRALMAGDHFDGNYINPYALSELFSQSEIPGFREIFSSDSYLRKFCWIVAFLFMTILSLNDMTELITEYYEYPITVDVRLRDTARLPFPAVTVCNLNVVRFSSLCSSSNARFDLTNKIPSELRDKLCGIQVEKKKNTNTSDSDISDINNIGFVPTTPAPTTSPATSSATTGAGNNTVSSSMGPSSQTTASTGDTDTDTASDGDQKGSGQTNGANGAGNENRVSIGRPQQQTVGTATSNAPTTQSTAASPVVSQTETAVSTTIMTTRRTTAKGSLDLDDFVEPSMLQTDRRFQDRSLRHNKGRSRGGAGTGRQVRSIAVSETNPRPFASGGGQIQLPVVVNKNRTPHWQQQSLLSSSYNGSRLIEGHRLLHRDYQKNSATATDNWISVTTSVPRAGPWPRPAFTSMGASPVGSANQLSSKNQAVINSHASKKVNETRHGKPNAYGNLHPTMANQTDGDDIHPDPQLRPSQLNVTAFSVPPALTDDFELTERQERELQENLTNWLAVMYNREPVVTKTLGHQFDDMILRCTMKSINCTRPRSFESSFSPTEGNCFTYRSKIRRRQQVRPGSSSAGAGANRGRIESVFEESNLAGTNDGLELVLNLEKNEYISGSSQVGALVMIHHPSDLGYEASEATFVAPEFTTYIGLKMVNITRLPAPYPESCVDSWPAKFADALVKNSTYSQQTCLKICLQKTIQTHCQCQSAFLPIVELDGNTQAASPQPVTTTPAPTTTASTSDSTTASLLASTASRGDTDVGSTVKSAAKTTPTAPQQQRIIICDTRRSATRQCVKEVMIRAAGRVHNCECPPKCQVVRYDKTISMARWPTREDKVTFDRGKTDVNFQNLAKVIVYFQTMTCEEVTQQAVFNAAKLFSALGGIMGMYVGFSFLSVFEILEVMSRKVWHYVTVQFTPPPPVSLSNRLATRSLEQSQRQPSPKAKTKVSPMAASSAAININNNIRNINSFARRHANFGNGTDWPVM